MVPFLHLSCFGCNKDGISCGCGNGCICDVGAGFANRR